MPKGKHNSPKPKNVLPKAAEELAKANESGLTYQIPDGPVKEHMQKMYELYEREQMMQFEKGFVYEPPGRRWTRCDELLPTDGEEVLVLCPGYWGGTSDPLNQRISFKAFQGSFKCTEGWSILGLERRPPIYAWMNIPEFPDSWVQEIKDHG